MSAVRHRCPECGFQVFNRRVPKCESCGAPLPPALLYSREQIAELDAEHEKRRQERERRARAARGEAYDAGGVEAGTVWSGDGDGGDGE